MEHAGNRKSGMLSTFDLCAYTIHNTHLALVDILKNNESSLSQTEKRQQAQMRVHFKQVSEAWVLLQQQIRDTLRTNKTKLGDVREITYQTEKVLRPVIVQLTGRKLKKP